MKRIAFVVLSLCAVVARAEDTATEIPNLSKWYVGAGVGYFDVDYSDGKRPHPNSATFSGFIGRSMGDYLALELQVENVTNADATGFDNFTTQFKGIGYSPGLVVKYPIDRKNDVDVFLRFGGTYFDYDVKTLETGTQISDTGWQPSFGGGFRTKHFFFEYVNYGVLEELHLDQIRAGVQFRF